MKDMDNVVIKKGETVSFKDDWEKDGKVVGFKNGWVVLKVYDSNTGGDEERWVEPDRIWHE